MKKKNVKDFTPEEKEMMDTIAVNYILAQADGFQLGYAQALADFTENIIDYWEGIDDKPQQCVLDLLVDLGVELGKRKIIAEKNIVETGKRGYKKYYIWEYKEADMKFSKRVALFTKIEEEKETDDTEND